MQPNIIRTHGSFDFAYTDDRDHLRRAVLLFETSLEPTPMIARSMFKMSQILEDMGRGDEAAEKRTEAIRLRSTITTFPYDTDLTAEAFDTLVPSFLR